MDRDRLNWTFLQMVCRQDDSRQRQERWRHSVSGRALQWEDCFCSCFGVEWKTLAANANQWSDRLGAFIQHAYDKFRRKSPEAVYRAKGSKEKPGAPVRASTERNKRRKVMDDSEIQWSPADGSPTRV
eukprot:4747125-Karenia_brevis.AAC.1